MLVIAATRLYGPYSDICMACNGSYQAVGCEASPSHPCIVDNDSASVSLLLTAVVTVCKHREAAPARLSLPQQYKDENSW